MPPKKKQTPRSGYYMFMVELQEKYRRNGQNKNMDQMRVFASPAWNQLTVSQKDHYNAQAKIHKKELRHTQEKLASDGTSIKANMMLLTEAEQRKQKMVLDIGDYIGTQEEDTELYKGYASRKPIYIATFNILCCTSEGIYIPLEIGIAEYTIQRGICRLYHKFIYPGLIPTGYHGEAKRHAEASHQIPPIGLEESVRDYPALVQEIREFLSDNHDEISPVFCLTGSVEQTEGCFEWLCYAAGVKPVDLFQVWDLCELLFIARSKTGDNMPSSLIANAELSKNTFDYSIGSRCDFHEDIDSPHCALGCTKRLCFLFSDSACGVFDVEPTSKHLPNRAVENKPYEVFYPAPNNFTHQEEEKPKSTRMKVGPIRSAYRDEDDCESVNEDASSVASSIRQPKPISIANEIAQLSLNAPTVAFGVGVGRGRNVKN